MNADGPTCLCVGISGGSGAGKSTFTNLLVEHFADLQPAVLHQDRYFRDWSEIPEAEREAARTVNAPEGMAWPAFLERFRNLRAGIAITEPAPGTRLGARHSAVSEVAPSAVLIVEGLFALWQPELRAMLNLAVYLDVPPDERILRRLLRDVAERGGDLTRSAAWYRRDVLPNFSVYTEASRRHADLIIPWTQRNLAAVTVVTDWIRAELARRAAAQCDGEESKGLGHASAVPPCKR